MLRASLKDVESAQKAFHWSEMDIRELLGGKKGKSVSPMRDHNLPTRETNDFFTIQLIA